MSYSNFTATEASSNLWSKTKPGIETVSANDYFLVFIQHHEISTFDLDSTSLSIFTVKGDPPFQSSLQCLSCFGRSCSPLRFRSSTLPNSPALFCRLLFFDSPPQYVCGKQAGRKLPGYLVLSYLFHHDEVRCKYIDWTDHDDNTFLFQPSHHTINTVSPIASAPVIFKRERADYPLEWCAIASCLLLLPRWLEVSSPCGHLGW